MSNRTPVTPAGRRQHDHLPPAEAVRRAWQDTGQHPAHHRAMQREVAERMPLLARALNRLPTTDTRNVYQK